MPTLFETQVLETLQRCQDTYLDGCDGFLAAVLADEGKSLFCTHWGGAQVQHSYHRHFPAIDAALGRLLRRGMVNRIPW